jgi:hypothetical protein
MRFLVDAQLPPALARWLEARIGNTTRPALLEWFGQVLPKIESALSSGESLVEVI